MLSVEKETAQVLPTCGKEVGTGAPWGLGGKDRNEFAMWKQGRLGHSLWGTNGCSLWGPDVIGCSLWKRSLREKKSLLLHLLLKDTEFCSIVTERLFRNAKQWRIIVLYR